MNRQHSVFTPCWKLVVVLAMTACITTAIVAPAPAEPSAAEKLKALDTSLNLIPEDAAFYSSMLRNREQIDAILQSRAWAKFQELPLVQMAWQTYETTSASPHAKAAQVKMVLENPQVKDLLALLGDMFSRDVFVYGDADMVDFLKLMQEVGTAMNYGPVLLKISGQMEDVDINRIKAMVLIAALAENADQIKLPSMVFGFKVEDTARATIHLGKLEFIAGALLASQGPELASALKRTKIDGQDYLVLTLEGNMIPWDKIPLEKLKGVLELEEGSVERLVEKLKQKSLVIAMGLRGDYLLVSIGSSTEPLTKLGKGAGLVSRPEMVPLAKFADRRLVSIDYLSKEFMEVFSSGRQDVDDFMEFAEQMLLESKLTDQQQAQVRKDATELAQTIKQRMPVVGATSGVSFLSKRGIESFSYDWSMHPALDGTKALGLLTHVGSSPILAVVSRGKVSVEEYDLMVKWLRKGYGYFKKYGVPQMQESEREKFEKFAELAEPILARAHKATREKLLPALDGQVGLVVDGKLTSKQFLKTLPATDKEMPMIEPAIVLGVRDADLMREALVEYWGIIQETLDTAAQIEPAFDDVLLPEPETIDTANGELFAFVPPEECPVDKQLTPNVGVGKDVCVFSMSQAHTERLLKATPLSAGGVLSKTDRPMAVAVVFDWAGLLRAGRPWIDLAVEKILDQTLGPDADEADREGIQKQVHTVVELLSVLRCVTSEAHFEDGVMVVHTLTEIRDVD